MDGECDLERSDCTAALVAFGVNSVAAFGLILPAGTVSAFLLSWNQFWEGILPPRFPVLTDASDS